MPPSSSLPPEDIKLVIEPHVRFIKDLDNKKDQLEYWVTEHLRLNGLYWGLTAVHLLKRPDAISRQGAIDFVLSCQTENGGFGAAPGHDAHLLYTCSAIQILATLDALHEIEARFQGGKLKVAKWITNLQDSETGTWAGDEWGEKDTRFLYSALNALSLLDMLHLVNTEKVVQYVVSCANADGAYGTCPGAESHSGQVFACLGALSICGRLDTVDKDKLGGWLSERQVDDGGLNGRPEKLEDVCYSWWVGCSLTMINRLHWIDGEKLTQFILRCQDTENGGFSDRPGNQVDVFHTVFGIAGLSLLGYPGLEEVDAT
ncbi:Geranylgeranyl transferase type-2 subunit beta 1 [Podosphaera aphanis]|nr:Geranylgeranyl transferase type-2 subunit beta 1 [Podosphaera aphanis]